MSKEVTAAEILQSIPKESLDSQVSDEHIAEIARQMKRWEIYMPDLLGEDAEAVSEEIKQNHQSDYGLQKQKVFVRWKAKFGSKATYHRLIVIFCKAKQADLAEKVKQLLLASSSNAQSAFNTSVLAEYRKHLVSCYRESLHPSCIGWPQAVAETYINLPLTEVPPQPMKQKKGTQKRVELGELFKTGKSDQQQKVILIEGPAGCGKTTLTWYACREWAAGTLFPEVKLLIRLSLDDPSCHSAKSLENLIPHESSEMREAVANEIARQSGKGVCFLVDAWDEAPPSVQRKGSYVYNFLFGSPLPHCSIIITSRPVAAGILYSLLTAKIVVDGFDRDRIAQLAEASLGHHSAAKKELDEALRKNPRLLSLCNLPINTAIVLYLLQLETSCSKLPSTRTELFYALVLNLLLRHMQLRTAGGIVEIEEFEDMPETILKTFNAVCTLAFHGVIKSKTQFTLKDLKALNIAPPLDTLGLLQAPRQLTERGPQHRYTFLHYAVQEFLAAYHISKLTSEEQSRLIHQILHNKPLSSALPFYAGLTSLCNSSVFSILMEVTKNHLDWKSTTERMTQNPTSEYSDSRRLVLALMNCIYESQKKHLCKMVNFQQEPSHPEVCRVSFTGLGLDPMDCTSFGYFFANKQLDKVCILELDNCHVGDVGIEVFMKELSQGYLPQDAMGIELLLAQNDCSHHSVKALSQAPMLWGLHFMGWIQYKGGAAIIPLTSLIEGLCRARSTRCKRISLAFCVSNCYKQTYYLILLIAFGNLYDLDLSNNDIGRSSVMFLLGQSLKHSKTLVSFKLDDCNINDGGLRQLGDALHDNQTISRLSIANNPFSSEALRYFLKKFVNVHSRLSELVVDSQCHISEHSGIIKEINMSRIRGTCTLVPFSVAESDKSASFEVVKSIFSCPKAIKLYYHY